MYERAITELEVKLNTYRTNEPLHRAEGNTEQANLCAASAVSIEAAIQKLSVTDLDLQHRGCS